MLLYLKCCKVYAIMFVEVLKMYWKVITIVIVLMNLITFIAYGIDKYKAKHNKWRIPEFTLILFEHLLFSMLY